MRSRISSRGLFYWLRAPRSYSEVRQDELILAIARFLLGICGFWLAFPPNGTASGGIFGKLVIGYLAYGLLILLSFRIFSHFSPAFHFFLHGSDILWAAAFSLLADHPYVFLALSFFIIASAAFRWGFCETVATPLALGAILSIVALLHGLSPAQLVPSRNEADLFSYILVCLAVIAIIGLMAEVKALRSEKALITKIAEGIQVGTGFKQVLRTVYGEVLQLFGANQILLAVQEKNEGRLYLYRANSSQTTELLLQFSELDYSQRDQYFFPAAGGGWRLERVRGAGLPQFNCQSLSAGKVKACKDGCLPPDSFLAEHPFRRLLAVSVGIGDEWAVRVFILDPMHRVAGRAGLQFLDRLVHQVAPMIHGVFLVRRLRMKAEALASKRIAHELHDGVIQTLAGIDIQLEELRRQPGSPASQSGDPLARIQQSIRSEITVLREFTQQLRALEVDSRNIIGFLSNLAAKFQIENGISTRFISDVKEVRLAADTCMELARITQEALVNIRKHSAASQALVRLRGLDGRWALSIIDNGRGFGFSGRYSHQQLEESGKGPSVIMERARRINAEVSIESLQERYSCLDIIFPREIHE